MYASALIALSSLAAAAPALAQTTVERLGDNSNYIREECLGPCACAIRIPNPSPMTGQFTLTFDHQDMWTRYYTVSAVSFHSSTMMEPNLTLEGLGTYAIGGDLLLTHRLTLDLVAAGSDQTYHYDSGEVPVQDGYYFPKVAITATTGVIGCQRRTVVINAAPPVCAADLGSQGGDPTPDGTLDNNDFVAFIDAFFNADARADLGSQGGQAGADGQFDNNDFIIFVDDFFNATGCP